MVKYLIFIFMLLLPYHSNAVIFNKEKAKYCASMNKIKKCSAGDIIMTNYLDAGKYCDFDKQMIQQKKVVICVYIGKERETIKR